MLHELSSLMGYLKQAPAWELDIDLQTLAEEGSYNPPGLI